jgi:hypothetical protein
MAIYSSLVLLNLWHNAGDESMCKTVTVYILIFHIRMRLISGFCRIFTFFAPLNTRKYWCLVCHLLFYVLVSLLAPLAPWQLDGFYSSSVFKILPIIVRLLIDLNIPTSEKGTFRLLPIQKITILFKTSVKSYITLSILQRQFFWIKVGVIWRKVDIGALRFQKWSEIAFTG